MGVSDTILLPHQVTLINDLIKAQDINKEKVFKIAYLGNQNKKHIVVQHCQKLFPYGRHDLYDIVLNNWDINKEWKIEGYDLIICYRTTPYVKSLEFFLEQLKKCISKNKYIIFDFTLFVGRLENFRSTRLPPFIIYLNHYYTVDFRDLFIHKKSPGTEQGSSINQISFRNYNEEEVIEKVLDPVCYKALTNYVINSNIEKLFQKSNIEPYKAECLTASTWNSHKKHPLLYYFWKGGKDNES
jgi:hypothetical protein